MLASHFFPLHFLFSVAFCFKRLAFLLKRCIFCLKALHFFPVASNFLKCHIYFFGLAHMEHHIKEHCTLFHLTCQLLELSDHVVKYSSFFYNERTSNWQYFSPHEGVCVMQKVFLLSLLLLFIYLSIDTREQHTCS